MVLDRQTLGKNPLFELRDDDEFANANNLFSTIEQQMQLSQLNRTKKGVVLVAEDQPVMRYVLLQALQEMDVEVDTVENGQQVLDAIEKRDYSMILMDCQMPVMNGMDATRAIRSMRDERLRATPIIALTCGAPGQERKECIDAGMDDYYLKPVSTDQLREIINRWICKGKLG